MKLERVSENQIRCFISRDDLISRQIKLSELAYGTEKAKGLFREMMRHAQLELGFEAEEYPLLIEAIPMSGESILLTVTKVEYPDELDSRFAYFSDADIQDTFGSHNQGFLSGQSYAETGSVLAATQAQKANEIIDVCSTLNAESKKIVRHFTFNSLDNIIRAAKVIRDFYSAENSLYKDNNGAFHLFVSIGNHDAILFNKICNILSEYGNIIFSDKYYTKITEHAELILHPNALNELSKL